MSQTPSSKLSESQTEESRFLKAKEAWSTALQDCVHADAWGQVVEAHEGYQQLAKDIRRKIPLFTISDGLRTRRTEFQPKDAFILENILLLVESRIECFETRTLAAASVSEGSNNVQRYPTKDEMKKLPSALSRLFCNDHTYNRSRDFPVAIGDVIRPAGFARPRFGGQSDEAVEGPAVASSGRLDVTSSNILANRPFRQDGARYLTLYIEKFGLKDAETYARPCVHVSVYGANGELLEPKQQTPVAVNTERYYVCFNTKVLIHTPVNSLKKAEASIFFEFVHFKRRSRKYSTRCWSLLEMDELNSDPRQDGIFEPKLLQIYRKPMDVRKKKIHLHSVKKLFAHVHVCMHE